MAASSCGVLLLSATFFRSRLSKLYYMIRMLQSPLPRTEAYLVSVVCDHDHEMGGSRDEKTAGEEMGGKDPLKDS